MKKIKALFLLLFFILTLSSFRCFYGASSSDQKVNADLWFIIRLRDYDTDMPISNTSISIKISTIWGERQVGPTATNETGTVQVFLGEIASSKSLSTFKILEVSLWDNYTLIKVNDIFLEDVEYTSEYVPNVTKYSNMRIGLLEEKNGNNIFIEGNLWVLKSKIVKISNSDPFTGKSEVISVKPAVKAKIEEELEITSYEGYYLFPINYEVFIVHAPKVDAEKIYPPLKVKISENTSRINWMYHAAEAYVDKELLQINKEMRWLSSAGFSLNRETEEYNSVRSLLKRVLDLYEKGEYGPALGGARISKERLINLKSWLSNLENLAVLTTIGISLFTYGLASLFSSFLFEEPSKNKMRLASKVLIFLSLMVMFSLTHPALKITYAILIARAIGIQSPTVEPNIPVSLVGGFITGCVTYFSMALISLKKPPMTDLALQLGMRSLKRRVSRTILTLFTITIIVSSTVTFVNVSMSRETRVKGSWTGTDIRGVIIKPDIRTVTLSEYDINWTREQEWCKNLTYIEEIRIQEIKEGTTLIRAGILETGKTNPPRINIVGIDPSFMEKYYNFSSLIRGFWRGFSPGEPVVIIPSSYGISTGEYVTLAVDEYVVAAGGPAFLGRKVFGPFRVIGKFEPASLSELRKIDNTPLFEDTFNLFLVPIKSIKDPSMVISEVTVITSDESDPVDVAKELAYMFGVRTVANKDRLATLIEWSLEVSIAGFIQCLPPLIIAGLMMYITMSSVYEERRRELSTLATLGLDPTNSLKVFMVEALLLGMMGTFLGFFGSYILVFILSCLSSLLEMFGTATFLLSYANWSIYAIFVALFTGVFMVFLGGYIPARRAQGLSLMGRLKKRELKGELMMDGNVASFVLPIKESIQNSELLYTYVRENIGKIKSSLVDPHSIKGEIHGDGSFTVSFTVIGPGQDMFISCELKGIREEESLVPVIEFPSIYRDYNQIREILRNLEEHMIHFSSWRDMQLKMQIVREAPKKQKTPEEILDEIRSIIEEIRDSNKKLKILETQRGKLSENIYNEFKEKYVKIIDEKSKVLRSMAIGLEPYSNQLEEEIKKINIDIERITTAYNLGEINEEEYMRTCGPLQARVTMLKNKLKELDEIFEFLRRPMRTI